MSEKKYREEVYEEVECISQILLSGEYDIDYLVETSCQYLWCLSIDISEKELKKLVQDKLYL